MLLTVISPGNGMNITAAPSSSPAYGSDNVIEYIPESTSGLIANVRFIKTPLRLYCQGLFGFFQEL